MNAYAVGRYGDFRSVFNRAIDKLTSIGLSMNGDMIFHKAPRTILLPDGEFPIVLSALQTSGGSTALKACGELSIRMYGTHRPITDNTDVYAVNSGNGLVDESYDDLESEAELGYTDES